MQAEEVMQIRRANAELNHEELIDELTVLYEGNRKKAEYVAAKVKLRSLEEND